MHTIKIENLSLEIEVQSIAQRSFRKAMVNGLVGNFIKKKEQRFFVQVLQDLNIEFKDNDSIGICGHNGSGKTSFLRLIAGIYSPTQGSIEVSGKVSTLLSLGQGMNPELSGIENIIRLGIFNGLDLYEAKQIVDDVLDFSDLGMYANFPVKTYSSGMAARLSFGVATALEPDILLIDEIIGVGDEHFQKKAKQRIDNLVAKAKILLLASHSTEIINLYCNRIIQFERGSLFEKESLCEIPRQA